MKIKADKNMGVVKEKAMLAIDEEAELVRLNWITGGAGQGSEYIYTEAEARTLKAVGTLTGYLAAAYPHLEAERQGYRDAGKPVPTAMQVAEMVIGKADAWKAASAKIKTLRRSAKMKVADATDMEQVKQATIVNWPAP